MSRQGKLIFCGDIHGDFNKMFLTLRRRNIKNACVFVCGDVGLGFKDSELKLEEACTNNLDILNSVHVYLVRGNHDDPSKFSKTTDLFEGVTAVKDYDLVSVDGRSVLCIGGGFSIDKKIRKEYGFLWWENEMPLFDPEKIKQQVESSKGNRLYVCTHAAPSFVKPFHKYPTCDPDIIEGCRKERETMDKVYDEINKNCSKRGMNLTWCYGHYHMTMKSRLYEGNIFKGLDINQLYIAK